MSRVVEMDDFFPLSRVAREIGCTAAEIISAALAGKVPLYVPCLDDLVDWQGESTGRSFWVHCLLPDFMLRKLVDNNEILVDTCLLLSGTYAPGKAEPRQTWADYLLRPMEHGGCAFFPEKKERQILISHLGVMEKDMELVKSVMQPVTAVSKVEGRIANWASPPEEQRVERQHAGYYTIDEVVRALSTAYPETPEDVFFSLIMKGIDAEEISLYDPRAWKIRAEYHSEKRRPFYELVCVGELNAWLEGVKRMPCRIEVEQAVPVQKGADRFNHDQEWQRQANEIAAELMKSRGGRKPTKEKVASVLAMRLSETAETVERRIRKQW